MFHGEILVGGDILDRIAFEGHGWRRHAWREQEGPVVDWMSPPRSWLAGLLDDGMPHQLEPVGEEVVVEPLHRAPLAVETDSGPASLERSLCRFGDPLAGRGLGWVEWLRSLPAS